MSHPQSPETRSEWFIYKYIEFLEKCKITKAIKITILIYNYPNSRKVLHGMAGNRFWSVRYSAMMVVRFDSDQPRSAPRGGRGPSSEPVSAGGPGRAESPGQRVWLAGPWRSRHGYRARHRGRLHGMASRPARCGLSVLEPEYWLPPESSMDSKKNHGDRTN